MAFQLSTSVKTISLLLGIGVVAVMVARRDAPGETAAATVPGNEQGVTAAQAFGAFTVRDETGKIVPLVTPGEPSIVMVSSKTCGWCKRALADIGEMADGRPVPRLKLLTLEGAEVGAPMLAVGNVNGAQLIGPAGDSDQVLLTFRFRGTPTFLAIDSSGRVVRTMPGYPIREEMKHWFDVMVGDKAVP